MKANLRAPFFEVGVKNYIYGDEVLKLAQAADAASIKYDIDVIFLTPYTDIRRVCENTSHLIVFAPYMDVLRPGRGIADVLPESIKAAGAKGVVLNHCERPMTLAAIRETIARANELELISFACANTLEEAKAIAQLHPDIINPEPTELIGTGAVSDMDYVQQSINAVKSIDPHILVEQAAGISSGKQVYDMIYAGADAAGAASGIVCSHSPNTVMTEMIYNVRKAYDDRCAAKGGR